jgi:hypothetical protein
VPRLTARDQEFHECLSEAAARMWDAILPVQRPSFDWLRIKAGFKSTAPVWAVLTRRPSSRPGPDRILEIGNVLAAWVAGDHEQKPVPARPKGAPPIDAAGLTTVAERLLELRTAHPLVYPDGRLPASAGPVSPASFVLRYSCAELEIRRPTQGDLIPPSEDFPYSPDIRDRQFQSRFEVAPDQLLERWITRQPKELEDEYQRPVIFFIGHSKALAYQVAMRATSNSPGLFALGDWSMRMSPDFVLIDSAAGRQPDNGWGTDGSGSLFANLVREHGFDGAMQRFKSEISGRWFLCSRRAPSRFNLLKLFDQLELGEQKIDDSSVIRFAIHHMANGHFQPNRIAVGGAPHYWAATAPNSGLRVLLTDEDLFGMPTKWPDPEQTALSEIQRRRHELQLEVNALRDQDQRWHSRLGSLRDETNANRWCLDPTILVFRADAGSNRERRVAAHYFRETFRATQIHWKISGDKRETIARTILDGYENWGGAGVKIPVEHMIDFLDLGMHLWAGANYAATAEPVIPVHELDVWAPFRKQGELRPS